MISALALAALISASAPEDRVQIVSPPERALCEFGDYPIKPCYVMGVTIDNGAGVGLTFHEELSGSTMTFMGVPSKPGTFNILGILNHDDESITQVQYGVCLKQGNQIQCSGQYSDMRTTFSVKVQLLP